MEVKWLLRFSEVCVLLLIVTSLPYYHQNDYDVKIDRMEVVWYNHSYARDVKFDYYFHTRTERLINASLYLLINQAPRGVLYGEVQFYKFMSNEYREFPLRVGANLCEEYARNNFNIQKLLANSSNLHACPLKKGFYYIHNFMIDFTLLPPFIPRGDYKGEGKLFYEKQFVAEAHVYSSILDKPLKWMN